MSTVGIVANGPINHIPDLKQYHHEVDIWIGADLGAVTLIENGMTVDYAVGDFDSVDAKQRDIIENNIAAFQVYPEEKDETDLEIALQKAIDQRPEKIYLFGVTGGRLDHGIINVQQLHRIVSQNIRGIIVDRWNEMELTHPGTHIVSRRERFPNISFVPFTEHVKNISLTGFYYPLEKRDISWGSTLCISNKLESETGTFTYEAGQLLVIQSRDTDID